jgi:hypothetical protein
MVTANRRRDPRASASAQKAGRRERRPVRRERISAGIVRYFWLFLSKSASRNRDPSSGREGACSRLGLRSGCWFPASRFTNDFGGCSGWGRASSDRSRAVTTRSPTGAKTRWFVHAGVTLARPMAPRPLPLSPSNSVNQRLLLALVPAAIPTGTKKGPGT